MWRGPITECIQHPGELLLGFLARITRDLPGVAFLPSDRTYVTDNAAMIAAAGYWRFLKNDTVDWRRIDVRPEWEISS